ncbi:DUF882 domain-containing protein [Ochrobactrum sp. CM-21-5]|nr:YcbK family protein [Ochrobactrum sp. CM-21-5]MBC2885802.1 DUF882 domain-containing protein [Ochrobactrum sp. CM-21-5]
MKFAVSSRRATGKLLSGSVALLALLVVSCTSTGTGLDGKPLQMSAGADGSVIADTLQSAADQTIATETATETKEPGKKAEEKPASTKQTAVAEAPQAGKKQPDPAATSTEATEVQAQPVQVAALAPQKKTTSLFEIFGGKSDEAKSETTASEEVGTAPEQTAVDSTKPTAPATEAKTAQTASQEQEPQQEKAAKQPTESSGKPVQVTSLFGSAKNANAYVAPQRPTASQGSIARLFSDESTERRSDRTENKKLAVVKPVSPSAKHEYNYSLPGVRPNGGIEIKHRNSIYDDSNIDANEDDEFANITLASAPGLARLAPNGLKVQRETVDVACLKPQLVSMLKSMERHFRRPVMVTSGYRSPSYNRKVNGARKSLHMICAAADIQIDGVSKWEIARFARSMPGRGGVGTYCHTTSVHVDVGPERDWNWRCKG